MPNFPAELGNFKNFAFEFLFNPVVGAGSEAL